GHIPLINRNRGHFRSPAQEPFDQFRHGPAIFLDGDAPLRSAFGGGEDLAPSIRFGNADSDWHAPFAHHGQRLRSANNDCETAKALRQSAWWIACFENLIQKAGADSSEENNHIEPAARRFGTEQPGGEFKSGGIVAQRNFPH